MNPNDIPADKLDKLRTYYINTKGGGLTVLPKQWDKSKRGTI